MSTRTPAPRFPISPFNARLIPMYFLLAREIEKKIGYETRVTVLGHVQRGGSPTPFDRILATRYGVHAMELAIKGSWGKMVALRGNKISDVPLSEDILKTKTVDMDLFKIAEYFFG